MREHRETKNELTAASLPYIRGTSKTIARILKPFNIRIAHKPTRTLRHLLTKVKDKDDPKVRQGTVYRIRCNDCNGTYIGETGRTLTTRLGEHQTATDKEDLTNNIAQHHRKTGHDINWDSATCLTHSTDKDQRLTLESWFTNLQPNPLNRSRKLPVAYDFYKANIALPTKTPTDFNKYVTKKGTTPMGKSSEMASRQHPPVPPPLFPPQPYWVF